MRRTEALRIDRMIRGVTTAFEPYQRFYAAESDKIERFATKLGTIETEARAIAGEIDALK